MRKADPANCKKSRLLERLDELADHAGAVGRLRELIISFAVQGRLVHQDPDDEPTEHFVRRITADRIAGIAQKYPPIGANEVPYAIPNSWKWVRLGEVSLASDAGWSPQCLSEPRDGNDWGVLKVSAVSWGVFRPEENKALPPGMVGRTECEVHSGDFLLSRANTEELVARSVVVEETPPHLMMSDKIVRFTFPGEIEKGFINFANSAAFARAYYAENASGTSSSMKNVGRGVMCNLPIPLPPVAEQKRIVAKVDELMALCDRLEAQLQERDTRQAALARAALARFADAPTPANLDLLFHYSFTITPADLRKTILQLAVEGRLAHQDPDEGKSIVEFQRIQERKAELLRAKQIGKPAQGRPINPADIDYDIPESWVWARLIDICELITDGTHQTPKYAETGRMFLSAQNVKPFKFMPQKHRLVSEGHYQGYVKNVKPTKGDVLLTRVGAGIGEAATIDQDLHFAIYVSLGLVRPVRGSVFPDYITLWLNSPDGTAKSSRNTYGKGVSQGNLNLSLIRDFLVPLPPLAEQRRIVARVDQLMALVDQWESQLAATSSTADRLLSTLITEVTKAP